MKKNKAYQRFQENIHSMAMLTFRDNIRGGIGYSLDDPKFRRTFNPEELDAYLITLNIKYSIQVDSNTELLHTNGMEIFEMPLETDPDLLINDKVLKLYVSDTQLICENWTLKLEDSKLIIHNDSQIPEFHIYDCIYDALSKRILILLEGNDGLALLTLNAETGKITNEYQIEQTIQLALHCSGKFTFLITNNKGIEIFHKIDMKSGSQEKYPLEPCTFNTYILGFSSKAIYLCYETGMFIKGGGRIVEIPNT